MSFSARADVSYVYPAGRSVVRQATLYNSDAVIDTEMDGVNYTGWLIKPADTWIAMEALLGFTFDLTGTVPAMLLEVVMTRSSDGSHFYTWDCEPGDNFSSGTFLHFLDEREIVNMDEPMWVREYITWPASGVGGGGGSVVVAPGYGDNYVTMYTHLPF